MTPDDLSILMPLKGRDKVTSTLRVELCGGLFETLEAKPFEGTNDVEALK